MSLDVKEKLNTEQVIALFNALRPTLNEVPDLPFLEML